MNKKSSAIVELFCFYRLLKWIFIDFFELIQNVDNFIVGESGKKWS